MLCADPRECHDLADDPAHAGTKARLRAALLGWLEEHGDEHVVDGEGVCIPFGWVDGYTHTKDAYTIHGRR